MLLRLAGRFWRWLVRRRPLSLADLDQAAWHDLGLSPADRLALARGCFLHDASRRQR